MNTYLYLVVVTAGSATWMLILGQTFGPTKVDRLVVGWSLILGAIGCVFADPMWTGVLGGVLTFVAARIALYSVRCLESRAQSRGQG